MRRVVSDMRNYLFADAIAQALKSADSDFDVHRSEKPEKTAELCSLCDPYALLMEVTGYTPWKLEERLRIRDEVKRRNSHCKIALIVDENAEKKLARQVLQAKKDGLMTGTRKDGVIEVQYGDLHMFFVKEGMPVPDYAKPKQTRRRRRRRRASRRRQLHPSKRSLLLPVWLMALTPGGAETGMDGGSSEMAAVNLKIGLTAGGMHVLL